MDKDEALRMALEALEIGKPMFDAYWGGSQFDQAITAIKEALAQPEQEPVAWRYGALLYWDKLDALEFMRTSNDGYQLEPLYTTPPQQSAIARTWVGLTDEELPPLAGDNGKYMELQQVRRFYKRIEAKLKEKNT